MDNPYNINTFGIDFSSVTSARVVEATLLGEDFLPKNKGEEELKKEILWAKKNGIIIEIPIDD